MKALRSSEVGSDGVDGAGVGESTSEVAPAVAPADAPAYITRNKSQSKPRGEMLDIAARSNSMGVRTVLPEFPKRVRRTHKEFDTDLEEYCGLHNVAFRVRSSNSVEARNEYVACAAYL
jgi:hypothetical protein